MDLNEIYSGGEIKICRLSAVVRLPDYERLLRLGLGFT